MLLSDNISSLLPIFASSSLDNIPVNPDPEYFFDLKLHFRKKQDHWKTVKQYHKTHPEERDNRYYMDGEINYLNDEVKTFHQDIEYFLLANPSMSHREAEEAFCSKWRGYLHVYGVGIVDRAILRIEYYKND
jgi:hypothetical protein